MPKNIRWLHPSVGQENLYFSPTDKNNPTDEKNGISGVSLLCQPSGFKASAFYAKKHPLASSIRWAADSKPN
jgi:hypothetical protein